MGGGISQCGEMRTTCGAVLSRVAYRGFPNDAGKTGLRMQVALSILPWIARLRLSLALGSKRRLEEFHTELQGGSESILHGGYGSPHKGAPLAPWEPPKHPLRPGPALLQLGPDRLQPSGSVERSPGLGGRYKTKMVGKCTYVTCGCAPSGTVMY